MDDSKALSQFIINALNHENIVLKSAGTQYYSYSYVADAVSGLLTILLKGENGQAYNVSDESSNIMLKDLAKIVSEYAGTTVIFDIPDEAEKMGYSKATKAILNSKKLQEIGWNVENDITNGIRKTLFILNKIMNN